MTIFVPSKCHKYSPSEPTKAYDKTVSRKVGAVFNPEQVLRYVEEPEAVRSHEQLVRDYLEVRIQIFSKQLIYIEVMIDDVCSPKFKGTIIFLIYPLIFFFVVFSVFSFIAWSDF